MGTVACVQDRTVDLVGNQRDGARTAVADNDDIGAHGVERNRGVDQSFTLFHARLPGVHVDHIGAQPLARNLEAQQRSCRILKKRIYLR